MLINLSITSLFTSSLARSPLFSTNVQYKLDLCQFNKIFPIVFYQTPKLNVYKTQFIKLQSELIIINSEEPEPNHNFSDDELGSNFKYDKDTKFLQCRFSGVGVTGSLIGSITASFIECLFYNIKSVDSSAFFDAQITNQLNIIGCCFSNIESSGPFFDCQYAGTLFLESNIVVYSKLSDFLSSTTRAHFQCRYCNISSNNFKEVFNFESTPNVAVNSTQFSNNELICLIYDKFILGETNISSIYSINNTFLISSYTSGFHPQTYAVLYISCNTIFLTDSTFISSPSTNSLTVKVNFLNTLRKKSTNTTYGRKVYDIFKLLLLFIIKKMLLRNV